MSHSRAAQVGSTHFTFCAPPCSTWLRSCSGAAQELLRSRSRAAHPNLPSKLTPLAPLLRSSSRAGSTNHKLVITRHTMQLFGARFLPVLSLCGEKQQGLLYVLLSSSGPDPVQVISRCLQGHIRLNLYLRIRRSGHSNEVLH